MGAHFPSTRTGMLNTSFHVRGEDRQLSKRILERIREAMQEAPSNFYRPLFLGLVKALTERLNAGMKLTHSTALVPIIHEAINLSEDVTVDREILSASLALVIEGLNWAAALANPVIGIKPGQLGDLVRKVNKVELETAVSAYNRKVDERRSLN